MPTIRPLWRALLAVFLTVTLAAVPVVGVEHAHAAPAEVGRIAPAYPDLVSEQVSDLAVPAERTGDDAAAGPCGACCCHASLARWDFPALSVSRTCGRTLDGIRAIAFDSVTSETLPKPPRTFA